MRITLGPYVLNEEERKFTFSHLALLWIVTLISRSFLLQTYMENK